MRCDTDAPGDWFRPGSDAVQADTDSDVFHFDNAEDLIAHLRGRGRARLTATLSFESNLESL